MPRDDNKMASDVEELGDFLAYPSKRYLTKFNGR